MNRLTTQCLESKPMPVTVNGVELTDADIEREMPAHAGADNAAQLALNAAVLRRVLLDETRRLNVGAEMGDDAAIEALLLRRSRGAGADSGGM